MPTAAAHNAALMADSTLAGINLEAPTAPARWLLGAGDQGVPLTQAHALARSVVREAVQRWPD
jgi:hypothetical protein